MIIEGDESRFRRTLRLYDSWHWAIRRKKNEEMNDVTSSWWHQVGHERGLREFELTDFLNGILYDSTHGELSSDEQSVE